MPSAGLFSWGSSWFSGPTRENSTPASEESPTRLASTLAASSNSMTAENKKNSEFHTATASSSAPEITSSGKVAVEAETWVRVEVQTTTQPGNKREETVTSRAGRGGRGRGKKNRGEDRSRGEEKGKGEDEGSGEITGVEAKGEIQVSRRPVGTSKPRERSRSRERGHRRGQTTTTTVTTTTTASPLEPTEMSTAGSGSNDLSTFHLSTASTSPSASLVETPLPSISSDPYQSPSSFPSPSLPVTVSVSTSPSSSQSLVESQSPSPSPSLPSSFSPSPASSNSPSASLSPFPTSPLSYSPSQTTGTDNHNSSTKPITLLSWVPVEASVLNSSLDYHPLLLGTPDEEEPAWSHTVGSGALLPGNMEEESNRGGANSSTITLSPTG